MKKYVALLVILLLVTVCSTVLADDDPVRIETVNITFNVPSVGQSVNAEKIAELISLPDEANYAIKECGWAKHEYVYQGGYNRFVKTSDSQVTIETGKTYFVYIQLEANKGFEIAYNTVINVNGAYYFKITGVEDDGTFAIAFRATTKANHLLRIFYSAPNGADMAESHIAILEEGETYSVENPVVDNWLPREGTVTGIMGGEDIHKEVMYGFVFPISVTSDGNGTASVNPASAISGTNITLQATPNAGYLFKEWQVIPDEIWNITADKLNIKDNAFTMPYGEVYIKAIFEKDPNYKAEDTAPQQPEEQAQPEEQPEIPASVSLSKTSLTIKGIKDQTVTATLSHPEDSIASVKSSKTKIAKVKFSGNDIIITPAKEAGKATITVTTAKGATAEIAVTVKEGWALNEKKITLKAKKTFKIKVQAIPATIKATGFKSDKPAVATVDAKGKVKAVKKGSATITVTLSNKKTLKLKVTVK